MTPQDRSDALRWLDQVATIVEGDIADVTPRALAALETASQEGGLAVAHLVVWLAQYARYGVEIVVNSTEDADAGQVVAGMTAVLANLPD